MKDRIRELRKKEKLNQIEFAKSIGISQAALSDIENGTIPSAEIIIKICDQYKTSADWILFGTESKDEIRKKYNRLNIEEKTIVDMLFGKAELRDKEYIKTGNL